jgi:hypothetical protein
MEFSEVRRFPDVFLCHGAHTSPSGKRMLPSLRNGAGV